MLALTIVNDRAFDLKFRANVASTGTPVNEWQCAYLGRCRTPFDMPSDVDWTGT